MRIVYHPADCDYLHVRHLRGREAPGDGREANPLHLPTVAVIRPPLVRRMPREGQPETLHDLARSFIDPTELSDVE